MPTIFTHAALGVGSAKTMYIKKQPVKFWVLAVILPVVPDLDSITFLFNIPYWHEFGHRGFFHSIFFSFFLSFILMITVFREEKIFSGKWLVKLTFFFLITASHGIFDAFTNGGLGVALLAPFNNSRYFFPYRPIPVSPIGIGSFFSGWGAAVLFAEIMCIWTPLILIMYLRRLFSKIRLRTSE